jgi:hypothetical protein
LESFKAVELLFSVGISIDKVILHFVEAYLPWRSFNASWRNLLPATKTDKTGVAVFVIAFATLSVYRERCFEELSRWSLPRPSSISIEKVILYFVEASLPWKSFIASWRSPQRRRREELTVMPRIGLFQGRRASLSVDISIDKVSIPPRDGVLYGLACQMGAILANLLPETKLAGQAPAAVLFLHLPLLSVFKSRVVDSREPRFARRSG